MATKLRKSIVGEVKATDDPMVLDIVGSTEEVDRDGDIIRLAGWELDSYRKNPVFMWAHNYSMPPLGKAVQITKDFDRMQLIFRIKFSEHNPMAVMVAKMYKEKVLNASSVGFQPTKTPKPREKNSPEDVMVGREYIGQELLELSAVPIPSNAGAVALALSKGIVTKDALDELELTTWDAWKQPAPKKCSLGDKCPMTADMESCPKGADCPMNKGMMDDLVGKPLPKPNEGESEDAFVSRCMGNEMMKNEYPKQDQRLAVCYSQFNRRGVTAFLLKRIAALESELDALCEEAGVNRADLLEPGDKSPMGSDGECDPVLAHILDMAQRARALDARSLVNQFSSIAQELKAKKK